MVWPFIGDFVMRYAASIIHTKIAALCPIDGAAIGDPTNAKTWRIDFAAGATSAQIAAAQAQLALITPALLAQADATVQAAAAAIPDPLATAKANALATLPTAGAGPVVG